MKIVKTDVQNMYENDYCKIIREFLDSGLKAAEVIELNNGPYNARNCFYNLIKRRGMGSMVGVFVKNRKLYLIRKNGEYQ